jgi:hypothetical protein
MLKYTATIRTKQNLKPIGEDVRMLDSEYDFYC